MEETQFLILGFYFKELGRKSTKSPNSYKVSEMLGEGGRPNGHFPAYQQ